MTDVPHDRSYDRAHHTWALRDEEQVLVGIDAIGLESLGELAYVALAEPGEEVVRGRALGTLEAAKMTTTIVAPVGGTILARNEAVLADPLLVNRAPYGDGWLIRLQPTDWDADSAELVSGDDIEAWAAEELRRLDAEA